MNNSSLQEQDCARLMVEVIEADFNDCKDKALSMCVEGAQKCAAAGLDGWACAFEVQKGRYRKHAKYLSDCRDAYTKGVACASNENVKVHLHLAMADACAVSITPVHWRLALTCLDKAEKLRPEGFLRWRLYHRRGHALSQLREYSNAIVAYESALGVAEMGENPLIAVTLSNIGVTLFEMGEFKLATEQFRKAIGIGEEKGLLHLPLNNMGYLHYVMHDLEPAQKYLSDALTRCPEDAHANYNMGLLCIRLSRKAEEHEDEQRLLEKAASYFKESYASFATRDVLPYDALSAYYMERHVEYLQNPADKIDAPSDIDAELARASRALLGELLDDIDNFIGQSEAELAHLDHYLTMERTVDPTRNKLVVLRRWNSYTPGVPIPKRGKGGGYFLTWRGTGVVIDPGFNFLENFYNAGYALEDIDVIIVTHAHIDHCRDLDPMLTLLYEKNNRLRRANKPPRKVHLLFNIGTAIKSLSWAAKIKDVVASISTLNALSRLSLEPHGIHITVDATRAVHDEIISDKDSVGLVLTLKGREGDTRLGYTSDTGWYRGLGDAFKECDILVSHLGTVTFRELAMLSRFTWSDDLLKDLLSPGKLVPDLRNLGFHNPANAVDYLHNHKPYDYVKSMERYHLGFAGLYLLAKAVQPKLVIVSEFGEELGPLRHKIARALTSTFEELERKGAVMTASRFLTGDIGLEIELPTRRVRCDVGDHFTANPLREKCVRRHDKSVYAYCSGHTADEVRAKYEYL